MLDWIREHWVEIGVIVFALHTLLKAIADVTKTKTDDALVAKLGAIIAYLFGRRPE